MARLKNWNGVEIELAQSQGGTLAVLNYTDNLISTGITPWPPPEIVQKLYQSRQVRAFPDREREAVTDGLGFYSDLQSLNSEDALTWSVFGPVIYSEPSVKEAFVAALMREINVPACGGRVHLWLWRRIPHPDTLVPGGPEIDFGILCEDTCILGEAKWFSSVGALQGSSKDKDQITLRREFLQNFGAGLFGPRSHWVVLCATLDGGTVEPCDLPSDAANLHLREITWDSLCSLPAHPLAEELKRYLSWKKSHSRK